MLVRDTFRSDKYLAIDEQYSHNKQSYSWNMYIVDVNQNRNKVR